MSEAAPSEKSQHKISSPRSVNSLREESMSYQGPGPLHLKVGTPRMYGEVDYWVAPNHETTARRDSVIGC